MITRFIFKIELKIRQYSLPSKDQIKNITAFMNNRHICSCRLVSNPESFPDSLYLIKFLPGKHINHFEMALYSVYNF